jgi:hypothetical protein
MWTVDHFGSYFPVAGSIPGIDLENLRLQVVVGEAEVITEELPHGLAGERQLLEFLLAVVLPCGKAIDLHCGDFSGGSGLSDLIVLPHIPSEADVFGRVLKVGFREAVRIPCGEWTLSKSTLVRKREFSPDHRLTLLSFDEK